MLAIGASAATLIGTLPNNSSSLHSTSTSHSPPISPINPTVCSPMTMMLAVCTGYAGISLPRIPSWNAHMQQCTSKAFHRSICLASASPTSVEFMGLGQSPAAQQWIFSLRRSSICYARLTLEIKNMSPISNYFVHVLSFIEYSSHLAVPTFTNDVKLCWRLISTVYVNVLSHRQVR
jgi:hypothetical protein